jgi:hypothetical protein
MRAISLVWCKASGGRLAPNNLVAMDAGLIIPPESLLWEREVVAWADHILRAVLTHLFAASVCCFKVLLSI